MAKRGNTVSFLMRFISWLSLSMSATFLGPLPKNRFRAFYGPVVSVKLVSDRETGRARGFGFVEMEEPGASAAIEALDNANFGGRTLRVNEAKPRAPRPPRY